MQYIKKANYASFRFILTNSDGSPVDLSQATLGFIVKKNKFDDDTMAILSAEIENSDTNDVLFQFDATVTAPLEVGEYFAALKIFKTNNLNDEVWSDKVRVTKETFNE